MKSLFRTFSALLLFLVFSTGVQADTLTLKTPFNVWEVDSAHLDIYKDHTETFFNKFPLEFMEGQRPLLEKYLKDETVKELDLGKIEAYLGENIAPQINRPREDVTIDMGENGKITFEGNGLYGRTLDNREAAKMIAYALKNDITYINLPLIREDPVVNVASAELRNLGIKELVSAGETDYRNSPGNRIINIEVGLSAFNGHLVKPYEEVVFGEVLGEVSQRTGYKPELVIKGAVTVPEYGGGLCQISTTAYRAALAGGFPITQRRNHSYAVSYYTPHGLDATIYPPAVDMRFVNDSPTHLLIQTLTQGSKVHYNYYGTKNDRKVYLVGPYNSQWISPPPAKVEFSDKLAPGEQQILGHAVPGLTVSWYRQVIYPEGEKEEDKKKTDFLDHIFSKYQARPDYFLVGKKAVSKAERDAALGNGY